MTDEPDKQEQINTAAESVGYTFAGKPLYGFSNLREACWQRLGLERAESEYESCIGVVFLCTLGDEIIERRTGRRGEEIVITGTQLIRECREEKKADMLDRLYAWADEHGLSGRNDAGAECARLGLMIWNDVQASRFRPIIKEGGAAPPNA